MLKQQSETPWGTEPHYLLFFFSYQNFAATWPGRGAISCSTTSPARSREFWHAPVMLSNRFGGA